MTGSPVALDTTVAIAILAGEPVWLESVGRFEGLCLPVAVIGELRFGAINSGRPKENLAAVESLVGRARVLEADEQTAAAYAEVRLALKQQGRPIPENDVWIAAACVQHGLPLATRDAHFEQVAGLRTVRA